MRCASLLRARRPKVCDYDALLTHPRSNGGTYGRDIWMACQRFSLTVVSQTFWRDDTALLWQPTSLLFVLIREPPFILTGSNISSLNSDYGGVAGDSRLKKPYEIYSDHTGRRLCH